MLAILSPNPATDLVNLFIRNAKGSVEVVLADMGGRVLWRKETTDKKINILVGNLAGGTYTVIVKDYQAIQTLKLFKAQ